ncbi:MAG: hypothetical protein AB8B91_01915, partial [Rubripirellula sp.]
MNWKRKAALILLLLPWPCGAVAIGQHMEPALVERVTEDAVAKLKASYEKAELRVTEITAEAGANGDKLRPAVEAAFKARQSFQLAQVRLQKQRLEEISKRLESRQARSDQIISQRLSKMSKQSKLNTPTDVSDALSEFDKRTGKVTVEAMPKAGMFILRGTKSDIEKTAKALKGIRNADKSTDALAIEKRGGEAVVTANSPEMIELIIDECRTRGYRYKSERTFPNEISFTDSDLADIENL